MTDTEPLAPLDPALRSMIENHAAGVVFQLAQGTGLEPRHLIEIMAAMSGRVLASVIGSQAMVGKTLDKDEVLKQFGDDVDQAMQFYLSAFKGVFVQPATDTPQ